VTTIAGALLDAGVSEREAEVLGLVGDHLTNAEISARLYISVRTVESHVSSLLRKLGMGDRRALADFASEHGGVATVAPAPAEATAPAPGQPPWPRPAAAVLPSPLTSFVGRVAERAALAEAVQRHRLVTAVGPGGVGKTRLALAVVADVADRFADGVWYVDLVPVTDPAMIGATVAAALGVGEQSGRSIDDTVINRLAGARALVVLDNAEHLVDGLVVFVERLLRACPRVAVLATSRARLLVPFEWTFPVGGLAVASDSETDGVTDSKTEDETQGDDAVALFVERATAVGGALGGVVGGAPGGDERRRIAAICRKLDGMALAIELAAARLPTLGLDGLEAGLADQLELLEGGQRLDDRHRSLRAMLDWSCALLDQADRSVLWRVALFAGPFPAEAATALLAPEGGTTTRVAATLARLADQSLLVVLPGADGTRYRMLETIRQYGTARLAEAGDEVAARTAHLRWALDAAATLLAEPDTDRGPWRAGFDAVVDDLRAALVWAKHQPDGEARAAAHRLALRLADLSYARGLIGEAQRRYALAADLTADETEAAAALRLAAGAAMDRHIGNDAMDLFHRAADLATRTGQHAAAARDLAQIAMMLTRAPGLIAELPPVGEVAKLLDAAWRLTPTEVDPLLLTAESFRGAEVDPLTFDLAHRAIELSRRRADPVAESAALDQLTAVHLACGDIYPAAASARQRIDLLAPLRQSAALGMEVSDAYQMATETALGAGDLPAALRFAEQVHALPVYREEPHLGTARLLTVEALMGRWDRVIELSERFLEGWERSGRQVAGNLALGASAVGMVHGLRGDEARRDEWDEIVATLRKSYRDQARSRIVFNPVFDAIVLVHRGDAAGALGRLDNDPQRLRDWFTGLWTHWYAALWAEASVLDGHPDAAARLARARWITTGNPVASALVERTEALAAGEPDRLPAVADALDAAGCAYQSARTRALAGGEVGRRGTAELAALGAAPMATPTR
jgi:predicted ATPase/DNA-binding CsgD family transcriptional regulator